MKAKKPTRGVKRYRKMNFGIRLVIRQSKTLVELGYSKSQISFIKKYWK